MKPVHLHRDTVVSIKNIHYNITAADLVDAVHFLNGSNAPLNTPHLPVLSYDVAGRSTGSALWHIPSYEHAIRIAHLLNNEVLDDLTLSASVLTTPPATPNSSSNNNNINNTHNNSLSDRLLRSTLHHRIDKSLSNNNNNNKINKNNSNKTASLLSRLVPKPVVLARLGPKKEDLLARLGPKPKGPTILGRLGAKPVSGVVKRGAKRA